MNITRLSVSKPEFIGVALTFIVLFGIISMAKLPMQLIPDIEQPQIIVSSGWHSAASQEIESVIIEPQENALKNIAGITDIRTRITAGSGVITLTFDLGTSMQNAMLDVINALNQIPALPLDAQEPIVRFGGSSQGAASLLVRSISDSVDGSEPKDIFQHQRLIRNIVAPRLKQIPGVARVILSSERAKELHITFDPIRAAAQKISLADIKRVVISAKNSSGGFTELGRRKYTIRFSGQYSADTLAKMIVGYNHNKPVYLSDVAKVEIALADRQRFTLRNGSAAFYILLERNPGVNTVDIIDQLNLALTELNQGPLKKASLVIDLSFDSSVHIRNALSLVQSNLGLGVMLSLFILWCFLRGGKATLTMALTIPIALLISFITLYLCNRSLNVISLAALAFSVGMVLDAAIIVQESIIRLRSQGLDSIKAILTGTRQVSSALFTSTITSVAIFVPILFMNGLQGQLFTDLALTLSVAILSSMLTALTVIPVVNIIWPDKQLPKDVYAKYWEWLTHHIMATTNGTSRRLIWAVLLIGGSMTLSITLFPKIDFLPRAPTDGFAFSIKLPDGSSLDYIEREFAELLKKRIDPYYQGEKSPQIKSYNFYTISGSTGGFIYAADPDRVEELMAIAQSEIFSGLPDARVYLTRGTMINVSGGGGGRTIEVNLQGADMTALMSAGEVGVAAIQKALPGASVRANPGLSITQAELNLRPNDRRITQAGLDRGDISDAVKAFTDGLFLGEYFDGNERLNVMLRSQRWNTPEHLSEYPIYTPDAGLQSLGELVTIKRGVGPNRLLRVNGQRTISLSVIPPAHMSLEDAVSLIKTQVQPLLEVAMPTGSRILYRGNADKLVKSVQEMAVNFTMAIFILFVLLLALFKSVKDSIIVLAIMPLAAAGGLLALQGLNLFTHQSFDVLTMIGFLILFGLVVNNSILLVEQTRRHQREGINLNQAVKQAVRSRARPIYMSSLTSLFGMLPLMLIPGVGSEIYRGLAAVIVGGMIVCIIFTPILLPCLLQLGKQRTSKVLDIMPPSKPPSIEELTNYKLSEQSKSQTGVAS